MFIDICMWRFTFAGWLHELWILLIAFTLHRYYAWLTRHRLTVIGIPIINLGLSDDRLSFKLGVPLSIRRCLLSHDDVIEWKRFPRYWPFVLGINRSPVNSPHKGQWRGASMFYLIYAWINGWVNNREAGDLRRFHAPYDVIVMPWDYCNIRHPSKTEIVR